MMKTRFSWVLFSTLLLGSCAENPATGARQFNILSEKDEYALGNQAIEDAVKGAGGVYQGHETLKAYYQGLASKIAAVSERHDKEFNFYLLDDPMVNAFALPGHVAFSRGLLPYLQNEAQLVSIIGHEVGHVAARHTAQGMSRGILAQLGVLATQIAVATTTQNTQLADLSGQVAGAGAGAVMSGYSRQQELEADSLGLRYMSAIGYNPRDAAGGFAGLKRSGDLFKKLRADAGFIDETTGFHRLFASHPDEGKRIDDIIAQTQASASSTLNPNEAGYMRAIDGVSFGMKPTHVVVRGQTLYGTAARVKMTFPDSFFVNGYVDGVPDAFDPQRHIRTDIQHVKIAAHITPAEVFQDLVGLVGPAATLGNLNGFASAQGIVRKGDRWLHVFILKDEHSKTDDDGNPQAKRDLFLIVFSVPQGQSRAFDAEADRMMKSFYRITSDEAKTLKPVVIRTRTVQKGDTVEKLAARQPFGPYNVLFLRAFNGLDDASQPAVGHWVKWVE